MCCRLWIVGLFFVAAPALLRADHPGDCAPFWRSWFLTARICPSVGCCPDDYVRKPCPPLVTISRCGGRDDYCRKPVPCIPEIFRCGSPADYCRKPLPYLLCPPLTEYLQCGTPGIGGACGNRKITVHP